MGDDAAGLVRAIDRMRAGFEDEHLHRSVAAQLGDVSECVREAAGAERVSIDPLGVHHERVADPVPASGRRLTFPITGDQGSTSAVMTVDLKEERDLGPLQSALVHLLVARAAALLHSASEESTRAIEDTKREAVHAVVTASVQHLDLDGMLEAAVEALRNGIRSQGVWIRAFDSPDPASLRRYAACYPTWADSLATDELLDISGRAARICWAQQRVSSMHIEEPDIEPLTTPEERDFMFDFMRSIDARGMLMAPMGGAGECQGFIALTRTTVHEPFDVSDEAAVLAIGRELGAAVVHARLWDQQRGMVETLQDLDRYKSQFVATVAHQLKNPLTSITGHTELLGDEIEAGPLLDREVTGRSLISIKRGAERMLETVDGLLTLSKVQDAQRTLIPGEVRMATLVNDCCDLLRPSAAAREIRIDDRAVTRGTLAWGDRMELETLVDNLVGNAVKYSPDGGLVTLSLQTQDDETVFECRDQGLGISEDELSRIFEPFHRSSNPVALEIPGTGLGMTIVKAVVDRHRGRITVDSQPNAGTSVRVYLPRVTPV